MPRSFCSRRSREQNCNYNSNQRLVEAIHKGHRGAFWDILRVFKE
jgi:hypothetical protein